MLKYHSLILCATILSTSCLMAAAAPTKLSPKEEMAKKLLERKTRVAAGKAHVSSVAASAASPTITDPELAARMAKQRASLETGGSPKHRSLSRTSSPTPAAAPMDGASTASSYGTGPLKESDILAKSSEMAARRAHEPAVATPPARAAAAPTPLTAVQREIQERAKTMAARRKATDASASMTDSIG